MRTSRRHLRARVNPLPITFSHERISAHGGLELLRAFLGARGLSERLRAAFRGTAVDGDYGAVRMVLAVVALLVVGGLRVAHVGFLGVDPVVLRFCGLHRLPTARTLGRWLRAFTPPLLERLADVIRDGVYADIERCGLARLTVDLDGTVLRTGSHVEGAARGFNPHHPKDPSYYPLTAHLAQLGQILRVWSRPGNVTDGHNADGFLRVVIGDLRARFGRRMPLELRMDAAFFMPGVFRFLDGERALEYALKVPFWQWLGLRERIAARRRWVRVDGRIEGFALRLPIPQWGRTERVVIYRKRVGHRSRKNFQLDLFDPADGHYEYSAVATNKTLSIPALWHFMAGRGAHEKTLSELKQHAGFAAIPSADRYANAAWQMLSVLTLNLVRSFQIASGAVRRPRSWRRTFAFVFPSLATLRFELLHQPARLVRPGGRAELRFAVATPARRRIQRVQRHLRRAA